MCSDAEITNMIPNFPNFKPIDLEIKNSLNSYLEKYAVNICDLGLGYLYIWQTVDNSQVTLINDNLCILNNTEYAGKFFLEPIGTQNIPQTIETCLKHSGKISNISEDFYTRFPELAKYTPHELPDNFDYIYSTQSLAELAGTKFHDKRNHIHKFKRNYPYYKYLPITPDFLPKAIAIFESWAKDNPANTTQKITAKMQKDALINTFKYFTDCNISGGYIESEQKIFGFIIGSPLNNNTFGMHFQYCLSDIPGIYQILSQEFCQQIRQQYLYVNLEEDLGMPGLKKMKLSYHPEKIIKKYEITKA